MCLLYDLHSEDILWPTWTQTTLRIRNSGCLRNSSIVYLPLSMFVIPGVCENWCCKVRFLTICVGCRITTAWPGRQFRLCNMDLPYVGCSANVPLSPVG